MNAVKGYLWGIAMVLTMACSKKDSPIDELPGQHSLSGRIVYEYSQGVKLIDLKTMEETSLFSYNDYSTLGWDISRDGKFLLLSERPAGSYQTTHFQLVESNQGTVLSEFDYTAQQGGQLKTGSVSDDGSMILLQADIDNGIVILDAQGNEMIHLEGINDDRLKSGDRAYWLPGNGLLIAFQGRYLLRTEPPYTSITLVREMEDTDWGGLESSWDGKRYVLHMGRHLFMMDSDGSNLTQVTESASKESYAAFSPDGKHLLVGTEFFDGAGQANSNWRMNIIPADGKRYDVDNSPELIPVIPKGQNEAAKAKQSYWIP